MPIDLQYAIFYNFYFGVNQATTDGAWIKRCDYCVALDAAFCIGYRKVHIHPSLIRSTEKQAYVMRLAAHVVCYPDPCKVELTTHSLNYVALIRPLDRQQFLTNVVHLLREKVFQHHLRLKPRNSLFNEWYYDDVFDI